MISKEDIHDAFLKVFKKHNVELVDYPIINYKPILYDKFYQVLEDLEEELNK